MDKNVKKAIEVLYGENFVDFTEHQRKELEVGRIVCPHGESEGIVQLEIATLVRRGVRTLNGKVVADGSYDVDDQFTPARWYACSCTLDVGESVPRQTNGVAWALPDDIKEDWE